MSQTTNEPVEEPIANTRQLFGLILLVAGIIVCVVGVGLQFTWFAALIVLGAVLTGLGLLIGISRA